MQIDGEKAHTDREFDSKGMVSPTNNLAAHSLKDTIALLPQNQIDHFVPFYAILTTPPESVRNGESLLVQLSHVCDEICKVPIGDHKEDEFFWILKLRSQINEGLSSLNVVDSLLSAISDLNPYCNDAMFNKSIEFKIILGAVDV
jgi:hypothetical protein